MSQTIELTCSSSRGLSCWRRGSGGLWGGWRWWRWRMSACRCVSTCWRLLAEWVVSLGQIRGCLIHRTGGAIGNPRLLTVRGRRRGQGGRRGWRRAAACRWRRRFHWWRWCILTDRRWRGSSLPWSWRKWLFSIVQGRHGFLRRGRRSVSTPRHGGWRRWGRRAVLHACRGAAASTGGTGEIRQGRSLETARLWRRGLLRGTVGVIVAAGWASCSRTSARRVQRRPARRTICNNRFSGRINHNYKMCV